MSQSGHELKVFWISANDLGTADSGGAVYSRSVFDLMRHARPDWEIVPFAPSDSEKPSSVGLHRLRQCISILKSLFGGAPAKVRFANYPKMTKRLIDALSQNEPDIQVLDGPDVYAMAAPLVRQGIPYLLVVHNIEANVFASSLTRLPKIAQVLLQFMGEAARYREFEENVFRGARGLIHISQEEMALVPGGPSAFFAPPTFHAETHQAQRPDGPMRVGFIGKLTWWPNKQGLEWFINDIWPTAAGDTELHLWGLGTNAYHNPDKRIFGHGFADKISDVWANSDIMVVPSLDGGGVNIKLCEALANGKPLLATPISLRGLPKIDDPAVVICKTLLDWQNALEKSQIESLSACKPTQETRSLFNPAILQGAFSGWLDAIDLTKRKLQPNDV